MQDLRDKLLKAGLVDKQQARKARTDKRRKRKRGGGHRDQAAQLAAQQERFQQRREQQAEQAREQQEQLNQQRQEQQDLARIRDVIRRHAVHKIAGFDRPFYFLGPEGRVRRLSTRYEVADRLVLGELAIVAADDDPLRDFAVVAARGAERLEQICPRRILFWNKPGGQPGPEPDLPTYGSGS